MISQLTQTELRRADLLRQDFERMVYAREQCNPDEHGWYLLAYWSLAIEHEGTHAYTNAMRWLCR